MWRARAMMFKHGVLSRLFWCWSVVMPGALRYAIFNSVHVVTYFLMLIRLLLLLLQVRAPPFTRRWLLNMYLPLTRERGQKVRRRNVGVMSSSTWFATDGYCLECQGRDLMLCSPSISCRLWINQMKHKLLYCKHSPIRLQATANVNWNHITSATGQRHLWLQL